MGAHELVEAGRQHVATGRIREAMACFKRAADDPERGAEALSLLAAAYLLPGSLAPELALAHAHRAASHPAVGGEHLARCAAVALTAGDPTLAEELAGRRPGRWRGPGHPGHRAAALGDLPGCGPAAGLERASGRRCSAPPGGRGVAAGRMTSPWRPRAMRRGGLPAPALPDVWSGSGRPLFFACLAAATVLAAVARNGWPRCSPSGSWPSASARPWPPAAPEPPRPVSGPVVPGGRLVLDLEHVFV